VATLRAPTRAGVCRLGPMLDVVYRCKVAMVINKLRIFCLSAG